MKSGGSSGPRTCRSKFEAANLAHNSRAVVSFHTKWATDRLRTRGRRDKNSCLRIVRLPLHGCLWRICADSRCDLLDAACSRSWSKSAAAASLDEDHSKRNLLNDKFPK